MITPRTITVMGVGYIGLPTACVLARAGHRVLGMDVNESLVQDLNAGICVSEEPGLQDLLKGVLASGKIRFTTNVITSDVYIICVPTPLTQNKTADLSCVVQASEKIADVIEKGNMVILESTVPPRTTEDVVAKNVSKSGLVPGKDFKVAFCPERVAPGNILKEIVENDRIVGGIDAASVAFAKDIYASFVKGKIHQTDSTTAEMVKLMENTYRDVNIALANGFLLVSEKLGIDVWNAITLANKHPRVNIHQPGPGVGGHCIPVVPYFIIEKHSEHTALMRSARRINDHMPYKVLSTLGKMLDVKDIFGDKNITITIWGVAFKPGTDDCSMSPATTICDTLTSEGFTVKVNDPHVKKYKYDLHGMEDSIAGSDCILLVTDHDEYKNLDPSKLPASRMKRKLIFDTRNALDPDEWIAAGFEYTRLGDAFP